MNEYISGSASIKQVICSEYPFTVRNGAIYFRESIYLESTHTNIFGFTSKKEFDYEMAKNLVDALNNAYKMGYEKDRI